MQVHQRIISWLSDYLDNSGCDCFIIGVSGGIDSSLVSTLCALSGKKTFLVSLPINQNIEQLKRAKKHSSWLIEKRSNVSFLEIELDSVFNSYKKTLSENGVRSNDLSLANLKSRIRMSTLYYIASINNGLVVGTGNKVEDFGIGFFTKYGDGGVDISPIADLKKSEVRKMASDLGIDEEILKAKPTDGLWDDNRNDEDQIGATYDELEWAMEYSGSGENTTERQKIVLEIYTLLNNKNKHKMVEIPIFKKYGI